MVCAVVMDGQPKMGRERRREGAGIMDSRVNWDVLEFGLDFVETDGYGFRSPTNPDTVAVKRVIALEGDTVVTRDPYPIPRQEVSLGHVWVEGEHPEHTRWSYDSNTYGAVCVAYSIPTCPIISRKDSDLIREGRLTSHSYPKA